MTMLTYLLHITIGWSLFALLYVLLLRRETFFGTNRLYLLASLVLGLILPLGGRWMATLLPDSAMPSLDLPFLAIGLSQVEQTATEWPVMRLLLWAYGIGVSLALARLLWGLAALWRIAAAGRFESLPDGSVLVRTGRTRMPFSFFHWIFVPENADDEADFDKILAHEQAHARGLHSADVLLLELVCAVFWFHPLAHWYRRTLRTVHEYLADAEASHRTGRRQYGLLLLRQTSSARTLVFANHFFQAPLKQRLLMLTRRTSPAKRVWRYGAALPVLALLVLSFRLNTASTRHTETRTTYSAAQLEKPAMYPGGMPALRTFLSSHIQYPEEALRAKIEAVVLVTFVLDETGAVVKVEATPPPAGGLPGELSAMCAEAERVVRHMPRWEPAVANGRATPCQLRLPIRFKLE
ncbi:MAG: M56 family metallopeptidase [Saprospiraceae bacterium]